MEWKIMIRILFSVCAMLLASSAAFADGTVTRVEGQATFADGTQVKQGDAITGEGKTSSIKTGSNGLVEFEIYYSDGTKTNQQVVSDAIAKFNKVSGELIYEYSIANPVSSTDLTTIVSQTPVDTPPPAFNPVPAIIGGAVVAGGIVIASQDDDQDNPSN